MNRRVIPFWILGAALLSTLLAAVDGIGPCGPTDTYGLVSMGAAFILWPIGVIWLLVSTLLRRFRSRA